MYKKTLAVFIFVFCLSFPVFSAEAEPSGINPSPDSPAGKGRESVLAFGFEYGNFWGRYSDGTQKVKAHKSAPGANMLLYSIRDGHTVGFFMHSFAGYPNIGTVNGIQPEYTDYVGDQIGLLLGPVFRHELNQKFDLFCGVGPNFFITTQGYTQYVPLTSRKE
ncbi:MAG: hypothetical protein LBC99_06260, partial [Spirochaetota bacterium]|nr:hypothetical protein [Spirochaetota bacterium]